LAILAVLGACGRVLAQNPSDVGNHPAAMTRTPAQVASDWGLLGSWRANCSAPVSQANITITYADVGGSLVYQRDQGNTQDSNPVVSATVTPDDKMDFVIDFTAAGQKRRNVIVKAADGSKYRAFNNSNIATGEYSVKDGKFTSNGQDAPWLNRCK
jgi:hypothetical protein